MIPIKPDLYSSSGYCSTCQKTHVLNGGEAFQHAIQLCKFLENQQSIALAEKNPPDLDLSITSLFGKERGKMFGVLECFDRERATVWLYGFSGQYNGNWAVPGWAPPLFDVEAFRLLSDPVEAGIKKLGREIESSSSNPELRDKCIKQRRALARNLMQDIHGLYRLHNFTGTSKDLDHAFRGPGGKPTGIGDCCGPKLLNQAAQQGLAPLSLAEFYFGRENRSQSRQHGQFYPPCRDKCEPILGFMLCGATELRERYGR